MKTFLIMNPGSRDGRSKKLFRKIHALMELYKIDYAWEETRSLDHALALSLKANEEGYNTIVAVGGDGTINAVINGFYDSRGKRISTSGMGVIYTGTSPDFCKSYNIPLVHKEAVLLLKNGKTKPVRIGSISFSVPRQSTLRSRLQGNKEAVKNRYFACCANIGIGASIARFSNSGIRKILGDKPGTFISLFRALAHYKPASMGLSLDNSVNHVDRVYNISVGITEYIASGIRVKHDLADDNFYVLTARDLRFSKIPGVLRQIYGGKPISNNEQLQITCGSKIEILSSGPEVEVEFDGDPAGYTPCSIHLADDPLDLIVLPGL